MDYYEFNRLCKEPIDIKKARKAFKNLNNGTPQVKDPNEAHPDDDHVYFYRVLNEIERLRKEEETPFNE